MSASGGVSEHWIDAVRSLGLEVISPYVSAAPGGEQIQAPLLIRELGARNGMLIYPDGWKPQPPTELIVRLGYGFSVLRGPFACSPPVREVLVEVFRDWGWSGAPVRSPAWMSADTASEEQGT